MLAGVVLALVVLGLLAWRTWTADRTPGPGEPAMHTVRVAPGAT